MPNGTRRKEDASVFPFHCDERVSLPSHRRLNVSSLRGRACGRLVGCEMRNENRFFPSALAFAGCGVRRWNCYCYRLFSDCKYLLRDLMNNQGYHDSVRGADGKENLCTHRTQHFGFNLMSRRPFFPIVSSLKPLSTQHPHPNEYLSARRRPD